MQSTGKIGKEDPTKHIIEKEEIKEDKDLQKLRDMVSSSVKHDLPQEEFDRFQSDIMKKARIMSNDSYKEVMTAYVGEKL